MDRLKRIKIRLIRYHNLSPCHVDFGLSDLMLFVRRSPSYYPYSSGMINDLMLEIKSYYLSGGRF